jgi:hypothetical protein
MGLFGGPPKAVKRLDEQLVAARTVFAMWSMLPEDRRQHARRQMPLEVAKAARAADAAGHRDAALAALDAAAAKPPAQDPSDVTWASLIEAGRAAL